MSNVQFITSEHLGPIKPALQTEFTSLQLRDHSTNVQVSRTELSKHVNVSRIKTIFLFKTIIVLNRDDFLTALMIKCFKINP